MSAEGIKKDIASLKLKIDDAIQRLEWEIDVLGKKLPGLTYRDLTPGTLYRRKSQTIRRIKVIGGSVHAYKDNGWIGLGRDEDYNPSQAVILQDSLGRDLPPEEQVM